MHASISRTERFFSGFFCALALFFLVIVVACSLFGTSVLYDDNPVLERVSYESDAFWLNILVLAASVALLLWLEKAVRGLSNGKLPYLFVAIPALLSLVWVAGVQVNLLADSQRLVLAAEDFAVGHYAAFTKDCYFQHYPFQLGYVFYGEVLARIFPGTDLNLLLQLLNCLWLALLYASLLHLTRLLCPDEKARTHILILVLLCMPCALYTVYAYGTLPAMALCGWALVFFIRMVRFGRPRCAGILCLLCLALSVVFKLNSMIMIAALGILALIHLLIRRQLKPLIIILSAALLSQMLSSLIVQQYARRSQTELSTSTPMVAWLAMGLQESEIAAGWYNRYVLQEFDRLGHDEAAMTEAALENIRERTKVFAKDPEYAISFATEKLTSQWNDPSYESLWIGKVRGSSGPLQAWGESLYNGALYKAAYTFMNHYQQLVLIMALLGTIGALRQKSLFAAALPLFLLGGASYHMLFEAKSQYIIVYFVFLLPLAAQGISMTGSWLAQLWCTLKHKRGNYELD